MQRAGRRALIGGFPGALFGGVGLGTSEGKGVFRVELGTIKGDPDAVLGTSGEFWHQ